MEKIDRRIQRTQDLLGEALVALILEKGYDAVTIKDVTERANVAYVTFFRHYHDLDDLLLQRLAEGFDALHARIEAAAQEAQGSTRDAVEGTLIFQDARENATFYRILLGGKGAAKVRTRATDAIAAIFMQECEPLRQPGIPIPGEIAANHIAASLLALIEWWLEHDQPYPPERMGEIYRDLITAPVMERLGAAQV